MAADVHCNYYYNNLNKTSIKFIFNLLILLLTTADLSAEGFYGCLLDENLCNSDEYCVEDNLFGECAAEHGIVQQLDKAPDEKYANLLLYQLESLATQGYGELSNVRVQCTIAYFKMVNVLDVDYDANFCNLRNPENIGKLLLSAKIALLLDESELNNNLETLLKSEPVLEETVVVEDAVNTIPKNKTVIEEEIAPQILPPITNFDISGLESDNHAVRIDESNMSDNDDPSNQNAIQFNLDNKIGNKNGEVEEEPMINLVKSQAPVLKKDIEFLNKQDTGLDKIEHKIVKGAPVFQKIDSNRVYLRMVQNLSQEQLYQLINYLNEIIAKPNKIIFNDFQLNRDQLSFRASRLSLIRSRAEKRLDSVEGIAEAVYRKRKDIESLSGVRVDETGIGSGQESIPVEGVSRDQFFQPILIVSAFTIVTMLAVLIAHQTRNYRMRRQKCYGLATNEQDFDAKPFYQNLFHGRVNVFNPIMGSSNKNKAQYPGTTSSWSDEPLSQSNIDISTGHVILSFLRQYLNEPSKIEEQWKTLESYTNANGTTVAGTSDENQIKNANQACLPYDDALIVLQSPTANKYINASPLYDSNPKQPNYIVTQTPLPNTLVDFWQMIWEQGIVLIANLTDESDSLQNLCARYWPENGSHVYGVFEVHLVSEHIWSEDYLVRSFYLKNLKTNETRTVTQFHFLSWPKYSVPTSTKALLDFRRKINKSYRGRAAPILVHSSDGTGRSGTYCLLDMELNRVASGVKELNIAGSLEHLRDQRGGLVQSNAQYKMVFVCLAEEINAMIDALLR